MRKRPVTALALADGKGALRLTPESLEAAYEFLRATLPFRRMKLPHADEVQFRVMVTRDCFGHFRGRSKTTEDFNEIGVSQHMVKSTDVLISTMAHEMIHLYQHETGSDSRTDHNAQFRRIAARVCRIHGFEPEDF